MCILLSENCFDVVVFHRSMVIWDDQTYVGVVVFHRSMVNWKRGTLVYVHSAICETYLV